MFHPFLVLGLWILPILAAGPSQLAINPLKKTTLLYQFPNGTWIENVAVRSTNSLLLTLVTTPDLYALDPSSPNPQPELLHTFHNATALFGIAEYAPDIFAVVAGNYSLPGSMTEGSFALYKVDFSSEECAKNPGAKPRVSLLAPVPEAASINGICTLSTAGGKLLLADITRGQVFSFDPHTRKTVLVVPPTNPLVKVASSAFGTVGVDGLRTFDDHLYAANLGTGILGKLAINADGTPQAGSELIVIARAADGTNWDDLVVDDVGTVYAVTSSGNTVVRVRPGGEQEVIAGHPDSMEIDEPTAVALSRGDMKNEKLFVVTGGGALAPGNEIVGGQVLAVDL